MTLGLSLGCLMARQRPKTEAKRGILALPEPWARVVGKACEARTSLAHEWCTPPQLIMLAPFVGLGRGLLLLRTSPQTRHMLSLACPGSIARPQRPHLPRGKMHHGGALGAGEQPISEDINREGPDWMCSWVPARAEANKSAN